MRLRDLARIAVAGLPIAAGAALVGQGLFIHAKAVVAQILLERAFAATMATGKPAKPWSWADTWPVARVRVPRLGTSAIVLAGGSGQALAFGPTHLPQTASAGEPGAAVLAAHRDTHFAFLRDVRVGDAVDIDRSDGRTVRFRVTDTAVVAWNEARFDLDNGPPTIVLATCWPFASRAPGPLRYLVRAIAESAFVAAPL